MKTKESISFEKTQRIAKMASLELSEADVKQFQEELSETINYIDMLSEVNTEKVTPTSQVTSLTDVFRDDKTVPSLSQEQALSNAKETIDGYFVTERVIK